MKKRIVVIGSSNTDMVVQSEHLPKRGETVLGGVFIKNQGGKGANQAVAVSRLGGAATFVARIGQDAIGDEAMTVYGNDGINTDWIIRDEHRPTGVALIMVDHHGENCISVALGANMALSPLDIDAAESVLKSADIVLLQLEIPLQTVNYTVKKAHHLGVPVILNPAPAQKISDEILEVIHVITPNETEAEILTEIKVTDVTSARKAAEILRSKGIEIVVITMGKAGAYVLSEELDDLIPVDPVEVKDTTAAGDTFNGALAVALAEEFSLKKAVQFANKAAAISVTKMGAQQSVPWRSEIIEQII